MVLHLLFQLDPAASHSMLPLMMNFRHRTHYHGQIIDDTEPMLSLPS